MHCEVLERGEQGNRERVSNWGLIWLKQNIHLSEIPRQPHLVLSIYSKNERWEGKTVVSVGGGEHKERVKEGEYATCWNCFKKGEEGNERER
jgi:hypothetical protein